MVEHSGAELHYHRHTLIIPANPLKYKENILFFSVEFPKFLSKKLLLFGQKQDQNKIKTRSKTALLLLSSTTTLFLTAYLVQIR